MHSFVSRMTLCDGFWDKLKKAVRTFTSKSDLADPKENYFFLVVSSQSSLIERLAIVRKGMMSNGVGKIWQKICFCVQDLVEPRDEMFSPVKRSGVDFTNFTSESFFTSKDGQFHQTLCVKQKESDTHSI